MQSLSGEADALDDADDPRRGAQLVRRLYDTAGLPLGPGMREALRRLEAGEDPEAIEAELGDALEAELPGDEGEPGDGRNRRRRAPQDSPPRVDPTLYEM